MASTRDVDDILAELLAGDEALSAEPELPEQVSRIGSRLPIIENAVNVLTAAPHAAATAGPASQQAAATKADADVELLFGDLLTASAQTPVADAAAQNSTAREASPKVSSRGASAAAVPLPAASGAQLADILDGLLDTRQPVDTVSAAAASDAAAKGDVARISAAPALSDGVTQRGGHHQELQQSQQLQQQQVDPFAASAAVQLLATDGSLASVTVSDTQQQQQQQQQVHAPSAAVGHHPGEAATASQAAAALNTSPVATATAAAAQSAAIPAAADEASDSDDDDSLDMLQDMAEVLEVQETVAAAGPAPAAVVLPPLAAAAHGTSSSGPAQSAGKDSSIIGSSPTIQQLQQQGVPARQSSAALQTLLQPSPSVTGQSLDPPASAGNAAAQLPAHEVALQQAWEYEQTLYHGGLVSSDTLEVPDTPQQRHGPKRRRLEPLPRLQELLADARHDWNNAGRPDASGTAMVGGSVLLKLESLAGLFAGAAGMGPARRSSSSGGGSGGGGGGGVDWSQVLAAALAPHGPLQVVAAAGPYVAVGSAAGSALVLQLPTPSQQHQAQASSGLLNPSNPQTPGHNTLPGGAAMWQLGEGLSGDGVTCLGFSVLTSGSDALWLAVGHESGALTVWELQKRGPRQVAAVAQHGSRLTFASFLPSRSTSLLLSADSRGRLCLHTFSNLLLRTNVSSKVLVNGQYGALLGISHLTPFTMPAPALNELGIEGSSAGLNPNLNPAQSPNPETANPQAISPNINPSSTGRLSPQGLKLGVSAKATGTPPLSPKLGGRTGGGAAGGEEALWRAFFEDGGWRAGEGVFCLLTPSHVYIARLKPLSNDLTMLFSIPQPSPGPQAAIPVAAWFPHNRKPQSAGFRVCTDSSGGAASAAGVGGSGAMVVPVAVLALGWGRRLVMFEVPLIGDHLSLAAALAPETPASAATALAAAAGQLRRGGPGSFASSKASQKAQQTLESLNPTTAAQVAGYFPLSISGTWAGGAHQNHGPGSQGLISQQGSRIQEQQHTNGHNGTVGFSTSGSSSGELVLGPTEPIPILGAHWLDADAVALLCQQGFSSLLLVLGYHTAPTLSTHSQASKHSSSSSMAVIRVQEQVEWMDQPVDRQWAVSGGLAAWGMDCQGSVLGVGPRVYLLGQQGGVFCGRLMPWSERLKTLQDVKKFKLGLYYALRFQQASQQQQQQSPGHQRHSSQPSSSDTAGSGGGSTAAPTRTSAGGGLARSEGVGAEPNQIEQWMLSLMLGHAAAALQSAITAAQKQQQVHASSHTNPVQQPSVAVCVAAEMCVCLCLLLSRVDVLFERVYPLFSKSGVAAVGAVGAFVEVLELAVLSDLLDSLPPEIMQALVNHFAHVGQPERVEGCVLHLSIMSLDLNQVIHLCESAGLYSALTFIYNHIGDYRKPLLDLLAAVAGAGSFAEAHRYCCKLLVYLRCCFRGLKFPPGTGYVSSTGGSIDNIKSTLLGSLLFLNKQDLITEWKQSGGRAATAAAALATNGLTHQQQGTNTPPKPPKTLMFCAGLSDPHPSLQLLLCIDVSAAVAVLSEMTCGWDAVETDLRAAAGKPAAELDSVLVATQVVVNAIIALLEAGKFNCWSHMRGSSSSSGQPKGSSVAMRYIIDLLAAGRVTVKPAFAMRLLEYLVDQAAAAAAAAAAATGDGHSRSSPAAAAAVNLQSLEQQFISILMVVGINAQTAGARSQQQQQESGSPGLSLLQAQSALRLAVKAGFVRAAATIHHMQGNCQQAIAAYLQLSHQQQQQQHRDDVFQYLDRLLSSSSSSSSKTSMAAVMRHVDQLIRLDAAATAALLLQHQPDYQVPVLLSLQQQPELQFTFLRAAMQQAMHIQHNAQQAAAAASDSDTTTAAAAAGPNASAAAAAADKLLERSEVADLYVRLLAKFDSSAVMPFLQSHHNYNVAAAIKACAAAGVSDAEAFLHERLGDLDAALRLYLSAVAAANNDLAAALAAGSISIILLNRQHTSSSSSSVGTWSARGANTRWGLGSLLDQITAAAAAGPPAATAAGVQDFADAGVGTDTEQHILLEECAAVAASLLQQLSPAEDHEEYGSTAATAACTLLPSASNTSVALGQQQSLQQQQQQQRPVFVVCTDLYKSWMAELSPRLKLKGLSMSSSSSSSTMQRTHSAAVGGSYSMPGSAAAAAVVPDELLKAWQALQSAIAFCQRNTQSPSSSSREYSQVVNGRNLWFSLMEAYVAKLGSVQGYVSASSSSSSWVGSRVDRDQQQQQQQQEELLSSLSAAAAKQLPLAALPTVLQSAAAAAAAAATHDLFRLLLDELVCTMADHLPLLDIVSRVLKEHGSERFGEFRSTLLGLFGSTAYEGAIMMAANRLITGDAFTAVRKAYTLRTLARAAQQQQQQLSSADEASAGSSSSSSQQAGPSSSAAAAAAVEPPPGTYSSSIPLNNAAVQTAQALGILRTTSSSNTAASSSSSALRPLTQHDKGMITGLLGQGLMHLQLQPAGPAAAHLPGVVAEYRAAASKAQLTKRMYKGEIDLAVEISLLHQQQQQQHVGQQQYYTPQAAGGTIRKASAPSQQQQQQQQHGLLYSTVSPGALATGSSAAQADAGGGSSPRESFDIDDLLDWSTNNMS